MSGDVQPRKRKDKKKKKDDLCIEEPRGTAAALGEGDVYMHSHHDHGTGGHWCAKIIFFSLLAVLVTLIGLIILENRGLSELEANSVESPYSNVLEGWIEDSHDQDHHDEHTLELKHPDNYVSYYQNKGQQNADVEEKSKKFLNDEIDDDDEVDNDTENDDNEDDDDDHEDNDDDDNDDQENDDDNDENDVEAEDTMESNEELEDEEENNNADDDAYDEDNDNEKMNKDSEENEIYEDETNHNYGADDDNSAEELNNEVSNEDPEESNNYETYNYNIDKEDEDSGGEDFDDNNSYEFQKDNSEEHTIGTEYVKDNTASLEEEDNASLEDFESYYKNEKNNYAEDEQEHDDDEEVDIEKIEKEVTEEEMDEEDISAEISPSNIETNNEDTSLADASDEGDDDFLEAIDDDEPPVEIITAPSGAAFDEIEEEAEFENPPDTLAEEEEYEKKQEELRREESETSHMWLKLVVGGALLVATHAVLRRFTAPRDEPNEENENEAAPVVDRRMTLVANEPIPKSIQKSVQNEPPKQELEKKEIIVKPEIKKTLEFAIPPKTDTKTVEIKDFIKQEENPKKEVKDKEVYNDEDEIEEDEEQEEVLEPKPKDMSVHENKNIELEQDENEDDVEIIDEELIEEELIEEEDEEEEISDVDDTDLLNRLEAKYGRLPEPERPGKQKDGGNSFEDVWPGEPSEAYWRSELDRAEDELRQGAWRACEQRASAAAVADSARARWLTARALDTGAEQERDNRLLSRAIKAYLHLLKLNERLNDKQVIEIAQRTINRIQFRGNYLNAEPVYRLLIRRFPNDVIYRNNLTISFLMANRADLADEVLKETLKLWPNDRVALAHYGFVLKNQYNKQEEAVVALQKALEGDSGPANEARFYYHLGDALLLLGRLEEAHEVHKRGAALGHFLSPSQRSLYNVPRLKSRPWWNLEDTPYVSLARALENSWREILKEGEAAKELFEKEKEGLKERGEWSQLDIFIQGRELPGRCKRAPVTCALVKGEARAVGCRRGQVKFSAMAAGTHVRAHVGPTNCRLRMHLGLSNTKDTFIRVDKEIRQWRTGKVLMFDDSFEHEVWHNGTGTRLVLIVDVWHPDITAAERRQLPAI